MNSDFKSKMISDRIEGVREYLADDFEELNQFNNEVHALAVNELPRKGAIFGKEAIALERKLEGEIERHRRVMRTNEKLLAQFSRQIEARRASLKALIDIVGEPKEQA